MTCANSTSQILDNNLHINQCPDGLFDSHTCTLNAFYNSIITQVSNLSELKLSLDVNHFVNCNKIYWNKFPGLTDSNKDRHRDYLHNYIYTTEIYNSLSNIEKDELIEKMLNSYNDSYKIMQWIATGWPRNKVLSPNNINFNRNTIKFPVKISCSSNVQSYDNSIPCNKICILEVGLRLFVRNIKIGGITIQTLINLLNQNKAIICTIDPNDNYYLNKVSDTTEHEIVFTYDPDSNITIGYQQHTVSLIGYECDENYIIFIFKDSYEYGTTIKRPGIFKIRVPNNNQVLTNLAPFGVGSNFGIGGDYVCYGVGITRIDKEQLDNIISNQQCCTTPTPLIQSSFDIPL